MANPTIYYFGGSPTTVILQSSDNFNSTAQLSPAVITPGVAIFPLQVGGGLFDMHKRPVKITRIDNTGSGTVTINMTYPGGVVTQVVVLDTSIRSLTTPFVLPVGAALQLTSTGTGTKTISITGEEAGPNASL